MRTFEVAVHRGEVVNDLKCAPLSFGSSDMATVMWLFVIAEERMTRVRELTGCILNLDLT